MSIFKITINAGTPARYTPNPQVVFVNDSVFWFNADQTQPHWPAPSAANPKGFMDFQIAPNSQSSQVGFNATGTTNYICNLHPGETGQIIVKTPKAASFGKKTKKGGFGKKTKKGGFGGNTKKGAFGSTTK